VYRAIQTLRPDGFTVSTRDTDARPLQVRVADDLRAIIATCRLHEHTCDLSNPDSPSTTVVMARQRNDQLDYLILADSPSSSTPMAKSAPSPTTAPRT
jgi:hypothetical protein